ncbi:MAG: hypothetical protein M0R03_22220 [Novosphingobium sp.]|nr:hypothetical protein [Novosphingobium sp.]
MKKLMKKLTMKETEVLKPTHNIIVYGDGEVRLVTDKHDMLTNVTVQVFLNYCNQEEFYNKSFIINQAVFLEISEKMVHEEIATLNFENETIVFTMKDATKYIIDYIEADYNPKKIDIYKDEPNQFTIYKADLKKIYNKKVVKQMFKSLKTDRVHLKGLSFNGSEYACTDVHRLHVHKIKNIQELSSPITIGQNTLEILLNSDGSDEIYCMLKDNKITILNGIVSLQYDNDNDYPDYQGIIPSRNSETRDIELLDKKEFIKAIKKLVGTSVFLEAENKSNLKINGFDYDYKKEKDERTTIKSSIIIKKDIVCLSDILISKIRLDKDYFIEMLEAFNENKLTIELNGQHRPLLVQTETDYQILMPLRG